MTGQTVKRPSRKRLLLVVGLASVLLLLAWVTSFLVRFDLNDYRRQAEERLSALLSLPVKIGDIGYQVHDANLALQVAGLQVGDSDSSVQIDVGNILIDLQWWELLKRNLTFARISLIKPRILVTPAISSLAGADLPQPGPGPLILNKALLHAANVDTLEILDGTLHIDISRPELPAQYVDISGLDGELTDIGLGRVVQLIMRGDLLLPGQQAASSWQLQGESALELDQGIGQIAHVNLDLKVKNLDLNAASKLISVPPGDVAMTGAGNFSLHVAGTPAAGFDFQAGLVSDSITFLPGPASAEPISFKSLHASGHLRTLGDRPGISNLSLQIDETRLAGRLDWAPNDQPFSATASLFNSSLSIPQLKQWFPNREAWQKHRHKLPDQGTIQVELAEFSFVAGIETANEIADKWRLERLKGELQDVVWSGGDNPDAEISHLPFEFSGNRWQISGARGQLGSLQLAVDGAGEYHRDGVVLTSLDFSGNVLPDKLREEWRLPSHALATSGQIGIKGRLHGPLNQLSLDLQADLSQLSLSHPAGLLLIAEAGDILTLHGSLSPQKIVLEHGSLKWSLAKGHLSGSYVLADPDSLALDALMTINDLARLAEALPALEKLQLHGQADLSLSQRGLPASRRPEGTLTLRDAGLHATRLIADLSQINGRVKLTPTGLAADNLRVYLGKSPLTVQARLEDFSSPRLALDVKAPSIRADELIFRSDQALLRDIEGHLEIDRNGLVFAPVEVRLDGGTTAAVRGTVAFQPPFEVQLDITAEFARIGEVVSLWARRSASAKHQPPAVETAPASKPMPAIRINAQVKRGDLYGMSFHNASGVIVPSRGRLVIHPLDFSVGEGSCNAQVITEFAPDAPSLLRISGHAEDVDALEVYRELLGQKNIVRGKLRGDFYLSGETGANFLPSSHGNFSIRIHDGVLHQFQVLSKVFSLLNVAQIFSLQLPDMDREGMPFQSLTANLQLNQGVLRSEDLKIESEAMNQSYVGQLDLVSKELDLALAIQPLGTVDKIVSRIPVAGWLLTGKDRTLLTAHFAVKGRTDDVSVTTLPLDTFTQPTIGLLRRTLGLPFKLLEDPQILWGGESSSD